MTQRTGKTGKTPAPPAWNSRGYLPPFQGGTIPPAITFRLWDSLPGELLERFPNELVCLAEEDQRAERRKKIKSLP